jgi:secretion/DNA translocation related TadE-like protein
VTFVVLLVAGITSRQHQLDAAADLSALAGADAVQRGRDPCTAADDLAAVNDAALTECTAAGEEITVAVRAALRLPFGLTGRLESRARAGPFHDWRPP